MKKCKVTHSLWVIISWSVVAVSWLIMYVLQGVYDGAEPFIMAKKQNKAKKTRIQQSTSKAHPPTT